MLVVLFEEDISLCFFSGVGERREKGKENLLRSSVFLAFSSLTRLARMEEYSFYVLVSKGSLFDPKALFLGLFSAMENPRRWVMG